MTNLQYKLCRKCNNLKELVLFSKHSNTKDKLDNRCKQCVKQFKPIKQLYDKELDSNITDLNNKDWQGGKIMGSIFERDNKYICSVNNKQKIFNNYNNAMEDKIFRSNEYQLTKNKYKIIYENNNPKYVIVQLTKNYCTLLDYSVDNINFIKSNTLFVSISSKGKKYYTRYYDGKKIKSVHHFILKDCKTIDHSNRQPLDNRLINLKQCTTQENNKNRSSNNDLIGIRYIEKDNSWQGRIKNNNKEYTKSFSINIYGKDNAFDLAYQWRKEMSKLLSNFNGQLNQEKEKLLQEFKDIMIKYSDNFYWLQ